MALATLTFPSPGPATLTITSVTRADTGANVTAVLSGSGVTWTLTVTEPAAGLTYNYLLLGTWADGSSAPLSGTLAGTGSPAGRYATLADWDNWAGSPNVESYSDKAGAGQLKTASVQAAMDYADGELETALQSVYALPLSPVTPGLRYWATVIGVGRYEYFGRGLYDADRQGDRFAKAVAQVYREMRAALAPPGLLPCAKRAGVTFGVSNAQVSRARHLGGYCLPRGGW